MAEQVRRVSSGGTSSKAVQRYATPHSKTLARGSEASGEQFGSPRANPPKGEDLLGPERFDFPIQ